MPAEQHRALDAVAASLRCPVGHDHLPGTTVNRYCSSSLQTIRMAFHALHQGR